MQAQQIPFYQFLEGSDKSFIIPVYQRDYAWKRANCQKLWDDLKDLDLKKRDDHFLGTVVTIGSGFQEYSIIDGQQRLTTISLLLLALHNHIKNKVDKNRDEDRLENQVLEFLVNKYSDDKEKRIRLKPNKQDKHYFDELFEQSQNNNLTSNIISNYNFFIEKINSNEIDLIGIFEAFRKIKIVLIDLVRSIDDPQLIFESLNSTGVDLNAGDLIRNYILMDLESKIQETFYNNYWTKIEANSNDVAEFIRNYLTFKLKISIKKDDVYKAFKDFTKTDFDGDKEKIIIDLVKYSEIYSWLTQINKHTQSKINTQLERLNKIEFSVSYPYLLDVFTDLDLKILTVDDVVKIVQLIETYAFRKMLVDNTTQGLNKLFVSLSKEIKRELDWKTNYFELLNYIILNKRISQRIPSDEEFENALINKEIYRLQSKNRNFLLESLEKYNNAYSVNLEELTIEHIMPQTLTSSWKEKLGDGWQVVHTKYLHTLGNISLTANNSELSNLDFEAKQKIDFQISRLKLNFKLQNDSSWGENEIIARAKTLAKEAIQIWKFPSTTYIKLIAEVEIFDLSNEDNFSNTKPDTLILDQNEPITELKSWRDLLAQTCKFLYLFSPTEFNFIKNKAEFKWYFSELKPLRSAITFLPNQKVEGNMSANSVIAFLKILCLELGYDPEKIQFTIKKQS